MDCLQFFKLNQESACHRGIVAAQFKLGDEVALSGDVPVALRDMFFGLR
jgi:hypothetical protein